MPGIGLDALSLALEEGEAAFHTVLDAIPELAWAAKADGKTEFLNHRWTKYTGTAFEDGRISGLEQVVHPDDRAAMWERWRESARIGANGLSVRNGISSVLRARSVVPLVPGASGAPAR
jgi:PAS domain-containing protein